MSWGYLHFSSTWISVDHLLKPRDIFFVSHFSLDNKLYILTWIRAFLWNLNTNFICSVNTAFSALRDLIPTEPVDRKLSKIETLRSDKMIKMSSYSKKSFSINAALYNFCYVQDNLYNSGWPPPTSTILLHRFSELHEYNIKISLSSYLIWALTSLRIISLSIYFDSSWLLHTARRRTGRRHHTMPSTALLTSRLLPEKKQDSIFTIAKVPLEQLYKRPMWCLSQYCSF